MSEVRAASLAEVVPGQPFRVVLNGTPVVLVRVGEQVYALGETCAHQGGPLGEGTLSGTRLTCPWHGWMYDVRTGVCDLPTRGRPVPSYPARVDAGDVWVELTSGGSRKTPPMPPTEAATVRRPSAFGPPPGAEHQDREAKE